MSTGDRLVAIVCAVLCAINVGLFVATREPISAAGAVFMALMFFAFLLDGDSR